MKNDDNKEKKLVIHKTIADKDHPIYKEEGVTIWTPPSRRPKKKQKPSDDTEKSDEK